MPLKKRNSFKKTTRTSRIKRKNNNTNNNLSRYRSLRKCRVSLPYFRSSNKNLKMINHNKNTHRIFTITENMNTGRFEMKCRGFFMNKKPKVTAKSRIIDLMKSKSENEYFDCPRNLEEMPTRLLEHIFANIQIWHFKRIRNATPRFCQVIDEYILHLYRRALFQSECANPNGAVYTTLHTLHIVGAFYMQAGYESTFSGCLLPMLRMFPTNPYQPDIASLRECIQHFLLTANDLVAEENLPAAKILYAMTLVRLLLLLSKETICYPEDYSAPTLKTLQLTFTLDGAWIGCMASSRSAICGERQRCALLAILAELFMAKKSKRNFRNCFTADDQRAFLYGYDENAASSGSSKIILEIFNSTGLMARLRKLLNAASPLPTTQKYEETKFVYPPKWSCKSLQLSLLIESQVANKMGCMRNHSIDLTAAW